MRRFLFHNFKTISSYVAWKQRHLTKAGSLVFIGIVMAGVFGVDTRQTLSYQLFSLLLILLLLAIISSFWFRIRLTVQRDLPKFATVNETLHYQITIYNHTKKIQQNLVLRDYAKQQYPSFSNFKTIKEPGYNTRNWFDRYVGYPRWIWLLKMSRGVDIPEKSLPPIPPSHLTVQMQLKPLRRGYVYLTETNFARPDPFGLFNALYSVTVNDKLLVLPKRYPVNKIDLVGNRKYQRGGVNLAMSVGDAEEFVALREYRPGDPLQHIHWKSWAKTGKPIVKEFQDEFFVRQALILDTFIDSKSQDLFETAVSVAASFTCSPRNHEVLLDLMFVGTEAYCFTSGRGLADNLLEILACVEPCTDKPFKQLYPSVMEHSSSLSGCICVLLNWDKARKKLIQTLRNAEIPFIAVVVTNSKLKITGYPEVHVVHVDNIATDLASIH
ncbi:DUF58 domain-containing protein [Candidatus Halobeggiatoa sp. HSG11]|nr:DUF58 domain-containing protein [Candidatus Halobeggiatoa sp. HSG11]